LKFCSRIEKRFIRTGNAAPEDCQRKKRRDRKLNDQDRLWILQLVQQQRNLCVNDVSCAAKTCAALTHSNLHLAVVFLQIRVLLAMFRGQEVSSDCVLRCLHVCSHPLFLLW
jgi:gluconate kinase